MDDMMNFWRTLFGPSRKELDLRLKSVEEHFVTKRDPATGAPVETLADIPAEKRKKIRSISTAGMTWAQRKAILERTDGGRRVG